MIKRTRSYVNEVLHQILDRPFVKDVIILNRLGEPIEMTTEENRALEITGLCNALRIKVESTLEAFDDKDELIMIRIRSDKNEIILTPDDDISVIVIQEAKDLFQK